MGDVWLLKNFKQLSPKFLLFETQPFGEAGIIQVTKVSLTRN